MAKYSDALTPQEQADAEAQGMTPAEYQAAFADPGSRRSASGESPATAKQISEFNASQLAKGLVPVPGGGWAPSSSLSAQEQTNIATGSEPVPKATAKSLADPGTPKETLAQAEDAAINSMYQGLLGQFTSAAATVNPYISGQAFSGEATSAAGLAQKYAGGGVQAPDPSIQGALSKDFQAEAAANTAGQQGVANAIQGMNKASQAQANVSPYGQLLNAFQSRAQSNIVYGGAQPATATMPFYVQQALADANKLQPGGASGASTVAAPKVTTASGSAVPPAGTTQSSTGG